QQPNSTEPGAHHGVNRSGGSPRHRQGMRFVAGRLDPPARQALRREPLASGHVLLDSPVTALSGKSPDLLTEGPHPLSSETAGAPPRMAVSDHRTNLEGALPLKRTREDDIDVHALRRQSLRRLWLSTPRRSRTDVSRILRRGNTGYYGVVPTVGVSRPVEMPRRRDCSREDKTLNASRAAPVLLPSLLLTACGPATSPQVSGAATVASLTTPAPASLPASAVTNSSAAAPIPETHQASAGLNVVHAPRRVFDDAHLQAGQCHVRQAAAGPLPDPACTPGAIDPAVNQSNIKSTICSPGYTGTVRPPPTPTGGSASSRAPMPSHPASTTTWCRSNWAARTPPRTCGSSRGRSRTSSRTKWRTVCAARCAPGS
ncbi:MAG: hypothetical protein JWO67_352, partial [Streptosporangiaceae bacterium]|nr:hypothetical protein [Streptosporangiaceae bacterium]